MLTTLALNRVLPYMMVIFVISVLGVGYWIYRTGYNSGAEAVTRMYEQKILEERKRLEAANEAALEFARNREKQLQKLLSDRNATIKQLQQESLSDPNASRPSVGRDGVSRIDRVH